MSRSVVDRVTETERALTAYRELPGAQNALVGCLYVYDANSFVM
jgi:hypothetical protein